MQIGVFLGNATIFVASENAYNLEGCATLIPAHGSVFHSLLDVAQLLKEMILLILNVKCFRLVAGSMLDVLNVFHWMLKKRG